MGKTSHYRPTLSAQGSRGNVVAPHTERVVSCNKELYDPAKNCYRPEGMTDEQFEKKRQFEIRSIQNGRELLDFVEKNKRVQFAYYEYQRAFLVQALKLEEGNDKEKIKLSDMDYVLKFATAKIYRKWTTDTHNIVWTMKKDQGRTKFVFNGDNFIQHHSLFVNVKGQDRETDPVLYAPIFDLNFFRFNEDEADEDEGDSVNGT